MRSVCCYCIFFFSSRRRHTRSLCDWSSDVCSSDLPCTGAGMVTPMPVTRRLWAPITFVTIALAACKGTRSEEHTSELQSHSDLVCRLLLEKKKKRLYTQQ